VLNRSRLEGGHLGLLGAAVLSLAVGCAPKPLPPVASSPAHHGVPPNPAAYGVDIAKAGDGHAGDPGAPTEGALEDHVEDTVPLDPATAAPARSPLEDKSDKEILAMYEADPTSLGSLSLGRTNGGSLLNGVRMPEGEHWVIVDKHHCYGTQETVDFLRRSIEAVHEHFPSSQKLQIGHISAKRGGPLSPHKSHQAGRDVDISYFYNTEKKWFSRAHKNNLDRARTWAFVRALITQTDVHMILIDSSIQRLLRDYAESIGEDEDWLDRVFQYKGSDRRPIIRHVKGHGTHIHIRFYNPVAQASARRAHKVLIAKGKLRPPVYYKSHKARKGDTLGALARKYGTTIAAIKKANGLRNSKIYAKKVYRIPKKGGAAPSRKPVLIPQRRLPPPGTPNAPPPVAAPSPSASRL